jgi:hypothetical protein
MQLPNFLIIGARKAGTTTLYEYLRHHPQIYMSNPKEPEFFSYNERYHQGVEWYASLFSQAAPHQVCGEASTGYTHQLPLIPEIPERIFKLLPQVKLIYIVRNPIDRAYSCYLQQIKVSQVRRRRANQPAFKIPETFEELLQRGRQVLDAEDYMEGIEPIASSNYMENIEQYLKFFPRESFLFLLLDDLNKHPQKVLRQICQFIGVDENVDLMAQKPIAANVGRAFAEGFIRERITAPLRSIPVIANTAALLPQTTRDRAYQLLKKLPMTQQIEKQYLPQPMLPETRKMLLEKFQVPNQKLSQFIQRDLSHWSNTKAS